MSISIKEIHVKTTIEKMPDPSGVNPVLLQRIKRIVENEVRNSIQKQVVINKKNR